MAVPGKSVGRVSIRVIPDATRFRNDLKLALKRAEQSMSANIAVTADVRPFEVDVRKLIKDYNGKNVNLNVDAKTLGFTAHLKAITRPRRVPVSVEITKKSAAQVATFFASLSGARLAGDVVKNLHERLADLDRDLPRITAVALGVASIGAAGLNAVHGLGGVAVGLAQLVPLAALLPGFFVGAALGITAMVLALKDAPKVLRSTLTGYKALQRVVSQNFWAKAADPIRSLLTGLLPQVRDGFKSVASDLGSTFGGIAQTLQASLGGGVLGAIFSNVSAGISTALPGLTAFTSAFSTLLLTGSKYLPIFGGWVTRIGQQFDAWLTGVEASGQLDAMIQGAILVVQQLGSSLASIGSILTGVFTAGGGDAIGGLAAGLAAVAAVVNSPTFQTALATIFTGAAVGAHALADALGPIGSLISTLAPVISQILSSSGVAIGSLLTQVASALSQPAFATGLTDFFAGIQSGLLAIGPALPSLAVAFGALASFAGALAAELGPVLSEVLQALAPVLVDLLKALQPLLPVLGQALISAVKTLVPVLAELAPQFAPLVQDILPIIAALMPPILALFSALAPILQPILAVLSPLLTLLGQILIPILAALTPSLQVLGDVIGIVADLLGGSLKLGLELISDLLSGNLSKAVTDLQKTWSDVWDGISTKFTDVWNTISSFAHGIFDGIMGMLEGWINGTIDGINGLLQTLQPALDALSSVTGGAINLHIGKIPHVVLPRLAIGADILPSPGGTAFIGGEAGRRERVIDAGLGNKALAATIALAQRALAAGSGVGPPFGSQVTLVDANGSLLGIMDVKIGDNQYQQDRAILRR